MAQDIVERLKATVGEYYGEVRINAACAATTIATLRAELEASRKRVEALERALGDVVNPLAYLQREAEKRGNQLGPQAYSISRDLGFVQGIARAALGGSDEN